MNGEKHTQHRRMLMPGFHRKRVDELRDTVAEVTEKHIASWRPGQQINLAKEMVALSLSLAITGLLGLTNEKRRATREPPPGRVG